MDHPTMFKSGDTKTDLRYGFMFSASEIKFVFTLLYNYCVYINTHIHVYM